MNATKRKFNALLQGIGTRSTPSVPAADKNSPNDSSSTIASAHGSLGRGNSSDMLFLASSQASDLDALNKRRRVGVSSTSPVLRDASGNAGTTTISNVVLRKFSGTPIHGSPSQPRYCPGDRDQLLKRLATFQELTDWTPKPDPVNEIEWAKRGWVCQGRERLRCTLCNKELVVKLNRKEVDGKEVPVLVPSEIEDALVEKYVELIISSHQDDCLWRKKGCDDSLLRQPLANPQTALQALRTRYDELCTRKDFLPYQFNLKLPQGFDIESIMKSLPPTFFTEPPPAVLTSSSSPNRTALTLAIMGWQGLTNNRIGAVPNSASCHSCLRRLGLWMFKSKEVDTETNTVLVPALMDNLDSVREHRFFCPWKNGAVQRNPGGGLAKSRSTTNLTTEETPGWEVLVQVIKNNAYLRNQSSTTPRRTGLNRDGPFGTPAATVETPGRPTTSGTLAEPATPGPDGYDVEMDEDAARAAKDKERWARLRKVKSLFDTKGGKKLKRPLSRPGTGHSVVRPDTSDSRMSRG